MNLSGATHQCHQYKPKSRPNWLRSLPGGDKFEFVMTGRHMTIRADGNTESHVAFGGPIFYGHAASGFNEKVHHPDNVFWPQGVMANKVYQMLAPEQQKQARRES